MRTYPGDGLDLRKRYVRTGEFRPPRKGEFFLSGAIPTAYLAYHGMVTPYQIAREATTGETTCSHCGQRLP